MLWNLTQIIQKIRNVTGTPDQLTDDQIIDYINSYYSFTMPFELKEQINLQPLNFYTYPNIDTYSFPGSFLTNEPVVYANGYRLVYYEGRDVFFQDWPQQYGQDAVASGDGTTNNFTGSTQAFPVIQGTFFITDGTQILSDQGATQITEEIETGTGITAYNGTLQLFPVIPGSINITDGVETFTDAGGILTGNFGGTGTIVYATGVWSLTFNTAVVIGVAIMATYSNDSTTRILSGDGNGTIDNVTGAFTANFNDAPSSTSSIVCNYQAYTPDRPRAVLFYNNQFTFRPVPDQVYPVTMQGYISQVQFNSTDADGNIPNESPLQTEWGLLIAYGASVEIFSDRGDNQAYNEAYIVMKRYEAVALNRTIQQYESQRALPRY